MLGFDARAARIAWTVFAIAFLLYLAWYVREAILIFVIALFLGYMLHPLVRWAERITGGRLPHVASVGIVYFVLLCVVAGVSVWIGSAVVEQAQSLGQNLPRLLEEGASLESLRVPSWMEPWKERAIAFLREQTSASADRVGPLIQRAVGGLAGFLGSLGYALLVPVLTFLFLKDAEQIRDYLLCWVPKRHRPVASDIMQDVNVMLAEYIRALLILSLLTGVAYAIFFEAIGLQYGLLISATAAVLEFIPYIGPLLGTVMVLVVAIFTNFPHIWWIVIFFVAYRAIQDYIIQPNLMASGTQLHPLVVFFGAFAGERLGGLWGMFLSVPVLAALRVVLLRVVKRVDPIDEEPEPAPLAPQK